MPPPSNEEDLKRRARRRLIGAVALTLVAVVLLPLLLEKEPPPAGPLSVHMAPAPTSSPIVAYVPASPPPAAPPSQHSEPPSAPATESPVTAKHIAKSESPSHPKPQAAPELKSKAEAKTRLKSESRLQPETKPEPKPEAQSAPVATAGKGAFVVQLAALSDAKRAEALKVRAAKSGFPVFVDQSGNKLTRVRVGPFDTHEEAVAAAVKLAEIGISGQVVQK